ncbi:MAG: DegV family protein [Lachnospiraceae bacterium]|nr:DegV family protein [Lachnospiraceae bacterium]
MSSFKIVTDSTADLPVDYLRENDITEFFLPATIKGETYRTQDELPLEKFYSFMRAGEPTKTSQVNPEEAKEGFVKLIESGCKEILYIAFSSGLSGTYNSGRIAADELKETYPDVKIIVIDTKAASLGEGLLIYYAVELRKEGKTIDETAKWVEDHKLNLVHIFTVDDLNHLYRGGRVSRSAAFIGTVLSIKPILHVDDEGHLIPIGKSRGRKKSLLELVDYMGEHMGSFKDQNKVFFISHGDCLDDAKFVRDEVASRYGIKNCVINTIGYTIGAHAGPGTVALFFLGDER